MGFLMKQPVRLLSVFKDHQFRSINGSLRSCPDVLLAFCLYFVCVLFALGVTAPSVQITTGTIEAFTLHIFSLLLSQPWYFSSFSCSFSLMLLSLGVATFITTAFFLCLSMTAMGGLLAIMNFSVCISKSHRIFDW